MDLEKGVADEFRLINLFQVKIAKREGLILQIRERLNS